MSRDYWLDERGPGNWSPVVLASALVGVLVTVPDQDAGLIYRGRLTGYDYDTRTAELTTTAAQLLGDDEWFPHPPRRTSVRCTVAALRPYNEGDTP